jgi:hypothetical protein
MVPGMYPVLHELSLSLSRSSISSTLGMVFLEFGIIANPRLEYIGKRIPAHDWYVPTLEFYFGTLSSRVLLTNCPSRYPPLPVVQQPRRATGSPEQGAGEYC